MSRDKKILRYMGRGMLISALISGSSGLSFAESDSLESMMAEGIPYETRPQAIKPCIMQNMPVMLIWKQ